MVLHFDGVMMVSGRRYFNAEDLERHNYADAIDTYQVRAWCLGARCLVLGCLVLGASTVTERNQTQRPAA